MTPVRPSCGASPGERLGGSLALPKNNILITECFSYINRLMNMGKRKFKVVSSELAPGLFGLRRAKSALQAPGGMAGLPSLRSPFKATRPVLLSRQQSKPVKVSQSDANPIMEQKLTHRNQGQTSRTRRSQVPNESRNFDLFRLIPSKKRIRFYPFYLHKTFAGNNLHSFHHAKYLFHANHA